MHPLATDRLYDTARATNQHRPHARLIRSRGVVTPLGDPRTVPFDARTTGRSTVLFVLSTVFQALVCGGVVGLFWWALA